MIKVYSTPVCHFCTLVKDLLKEKGFEFTEINVQKDQESMDYLRSKGMIGVPIIEIDGEFIRGFDKPAILKALKLEK